MTVSKDKVEYIRPNRDIMVVVSSYSLLIPVGVVVGGDGDVGVVAADIGRHGKLYLVCFDDVMNHKTANKNSGTSTSFAISLGLLPLHV